ncbi:hypothetical protein ACFL0W_04850 [Nanoarchaeota archaeon]
MPVLESDGLEFLAVQLQEGLSELFPNGKPGEYWQKLIDTPGDQNVSEQQLVATVPNLIDKCELKTKDFYHGAIAGILYGAQAKGIQEFYKVAVGYCLHQLEQLEKG